MKPIDTILSILGIIFCLFIIYTDKRIDDTAKILISIGICSIINILHNLIVDKN